MTGRIVRRPKGTHSCRPGCTYSQSKGGPMAPPLGARLVHLPKREDYPAGTVWVCDHCATGWVALPQRYSNWPGLVEFRREKRRERRRRLRFERDHCECKQPRHERGAPMCIHPPEVF